MKTELTLEQRLLISRFGRSKGGNARVAIMQECNDVLRGQAETLLAKLEAEVAPPVITDIQVYENGPRPLFDKLWVRYTFSDGDVKKFCMSRPEAGAIKAAWEAGQRVGAQSANVPRSEDED